MARTTIPAELVATNAIQGTLIADNAITAVHIATNAVSGTLVADNAITSTHIAQNNVTATQILQNTITVTQIADSAIETAKINNDAVTQAKIADDAVGPDQLAANAVVSASIANGTIVEADMADNAVTLAKMASLARGKIIVGDSAGDPSALAIGSNGTVLKSDGTDVSWGAAGGTTINSNADNRVITGSGTANTLEGESGLTYNDSTLAVTGAITSDSTVTSLTNFNSTSGNDLRLNAGSANRDIFMQVNGTTHMTVQGSTGSVGINETSPDFSGFGSNGGGLELDDVGSSFTAVKVSQGSTGNLYLAASTGAGYLWQHSNSPLIIGTNNAERIRIQDGTGRVGINATGIAYSSSEKLSLYNDNFGFGIKASYYAMGCWVVEGSGTYISFAYGSGGAGGGGITFSGASTSYTSASDYRLKENVDYTWDATTRLKQLKPCRFNWISDNSNTLQDGFLAHEVSSVVPEAISGEKDAVYTAEEAQEAPNTAEGDAKIQALDNAKLVPLLVKTIQELEARITVLEG